jgi:hypothetical protein
MNSKINYEEWLWPFQSIEDLLKAIRILSRFSESDISICRIKNKLISKPITMIDLNVFIQTAKTFPSMYPMNFVRNIEEFDTIVVDEINKIEQPSRDFICDKTECTFCNKNLIGIKSKHIGVVYFLAKKAKKCLIASIKCRNCGAEHFPNYATQGRSRSFYKETVLSKFVGFTSETMIETVLFSALTYDIVYKHSSFLAFTNAHNALFSSSNSVYREELCIKRLVETWHYFNLLKYEPDYKRKVVFQ